MISPHDYYLRTRRDFLTTSASGLGGLALAHLLAGEGASAARGLTHFAPRAKRCIFIFMAGGVSHVDSYDYKENLFRDAGKMIRFDDARTLAKTRKIVEHKVKKPLKRLFYGGHARSGRGGV